MVTAVLNDAELRQRAWDAAAAVVDPEIPVLTIADLGVLRDVAINDDGCVEVAITPTYSGCPAMNMIGLEIELALERDGFRHPEDARRLAYAGAGKGGGGLHPGGQSALRAPASPVSDSRLSAPARPPQAAAVRIRVLRSVGMAS